MLELVEDTANRWLGGGGRGRGGIDETKTVNTYVVTVNRFTILSSTSNTDGALKVLTCMTPCIVSVLLGNILAYYTSTSVEIGTGT